MHYSCKFVSMKIFSSLIFFLLIQLSLFAQDLEIKTDSTTNDSITNVSVKEKPMKKGKVSSFYNQEIDSLVVFQKNINKANCPKLVKGYRVQIYSCSGAGCQEKAEKTYNQFLIAYPEIPAERIWEAPSYKVRVGDCRNRFAAEAIKAKIKTDFPFIFVVPDYISSPFKVDCEEMK